MCFLIPPGPCLELLENHVPVCPLLSLHLKFLMPNYSAPLFLLKWKEVKARTEEPAETVSRDFAQRRCWQHSGGYHFLMKFFFKKLGASVEVTQLFPSLCSTWQDANHFLFKALEMNSTPGLACRCRRALLLLSL